METERTEQADATFNASAPINRIMPVKDWTIVGPFNMVEFAGILCGFPPKKKNAIENCPGANWDERKDESKAT